MCQRTLRVVHVPCLFARHMLLCALIIKMYPKQLSIDIITAHGYKTSKCRKKPYCSTEAMDKNSNNL